MMIGHIGEDFYDKLVQMSNCVEKVDYDQVKVYLENVYLELPEN